MRQQNRKFSCLLVFVITVVYKTHAHAHEHINTSGVASNQKIYFSLISL